MVKKETIPEFSVFQALLKAFLNLGKAAALYSQQCER